MSYTIEDIHMSMHGNEVVDVQVKDLDMNFLSVARIDLIRRRRASIRMLTIAGALIAAEIDRLRKRR